MGDPVNVNKTLIKHVLNTMDYENLTESVELAKSWFKENPSICASEIDKELGNREEFRDVYTAELIGNIYSPSGDERIDEILEQSTSSKSWMETKKFERGRLLYNFAQNIKAQQNLISQIDICARGILLSDTKNKAIPLLIDYLEYYSTIARGFNSLDDAETVQPAVVGIIAEDTYLGCLGMAIGAPLAAGFNVVLQTRGAISFVTALLIELSVKSGIPAKTITIVPGNVPVQKFYDTGLKLLSIFDSIFEKEYSILSPPNRSLLIFPKTKMPMLVFEDTDIESACDVAMEMAWEYGGEAPWSVNIVIVQESVLKQFTEKLKQKLHTVRFDTSKLAKFSYPISKRAEKNYSKTLEEAKQQGIDVVQNRNEQHQFAPTLLLGGQVHGNGVLSMVSPFLTIVGFRTINEGVALANNTRQGFGAAVWTKNISVSNEVSRKLEVSNIWVNMSPVLKARVPFSANKDCGGGYFGGTAGVEVYQAYNSVQLTYFPSPEEGNEDLIRKVITEAQKAHISWRKNSVDVRTLKFTELLDQMVTSKTEYHTAVKASLQKVILELDQSSSCVTYDTYEVKQHREPLGVVAIKSDNNALCLNLLFAALLAGNSVIVFFRDGEEFNLFSQIRDLMLHSGFPQGLFNLMNSARCYIKQVFEHREVRRYFTNNRFIRVELPLTVYSKRFPVLQKLPQILNCVTNVKSIWSSSGESFS